MSNVRKAFELHFQLIGGSFFRKLHMIESVRCIYKGKPWITSGKGVVSRRDIVHLKLKAEYCTYGLSSRNGSAVLRVYNESCG